jgi:hypothetical protein
VRTVQEAGRAGMGDAQVLVDATADSRAVLTHNHTDFKRLHRRRQPHQGIVSCTHDPQDPLGLASRVHSAISKYGKLTNEFIRVVRPAKP